MSLFKYIERLLRIDSLIYVVDKVTSEVKLKRDCIAGFNELVPGIRNISLNLTTNYGAKLDFRYGIKGIADILTKEEDYWNRCSITLNISQVKSNFLHCCPVKHQNRFSFIFDFVEPFGVRCYAALTHVCNYLTTNILLLCSIFKRQRREDICRNYDNRKK